MIVLALPLDERHDEMRRVEFVFLSRPTITINDQASFRNLSTLWVALDNVRNGRLNPSKDAQMRNMFRLPEGQLDRQYLRVLATFKLLKLCTIDETRAVELLEQRRIRGADGLVSTWVEHLRRNEWSDGAFGQRTILGGPYTGPRP